LERSAIKQRRFTSDASHELRSPITTIRAAIEVAMREPNEIQRVGTIAIAEIDRLDDLVHNLLMLSRLDEYALAFASIDLEDVVAIQANTIHRDRVRINLSDVTPVGLTGDLGAVTSVVRNLLDNAVRHARATVNVTVRALPSGAAELLVDDDGTGVPPDQRAHVFERFARLDDGRSRDAGGTGLGLAVVAAAMRAHGGLIGIEDSPSGGARFRATFPMPPTEPDASAHGAGLRIRADPATNGGPSDEMRG